MQRKKKGRRIPRSLYLEAVAVFFFCLCWWSPQDGNRVGVFGDLPPPLPRTHILREITRGHERTGPWLGRDPEDWPGLRNAFQGLSWDERQIGVCWNLGMWEPQQRDWDLHPQPFLPRPPPHALRFNHPSRAGMNCPVLVWDHPIQPLNSWSRAVRATAAGYCVTAGHHFSQFGVTADFSRGRTTTEGGQGEDGYLRGTVSRCVWELAFEPRSAGDTEPVTSGFQGRASLGMLCGGVRRGGAPQVWG